ncbi:MAG: glutathione S-transferase family protein [Reyranella sp.]|jgi:glutathione S-transferase|uniref:glutathione S-transferase family protein n=1 Tax=Reyranella sp. TaxID=1929291 RepID=UPI001ACC0154|nr:glutathione S-transferase family protein [Reyranella sp.]MBN9535954.1 glutathione S-transferase family protein [Alphaproteobacteria bacterium]MBR2818931.1 glutathione S-transferase family protein [Reyranella sp.]
MADFTLVIGNKNYSSWSLRGWLMVKTAGIEFDEIVVPLDRPDTAPAIRKHSPSGRVPVLLHRGLAVWESLAIAEYLNDLKPEAGLWPPSAAARAHARAISCEMHAGFVDLRTNMPMNIRASFPGKGMTPAVRADIERITGLWRDCRKRFAGAFQKDDGFLFGTFGAADAMFAPVATRFKTYSVTLDSDADAYCTAILNHPAMKQWIDAAEHEPWLIDQYELK